MMIYRMSVAQAQRVEQARQELISQVTESAAKTLETIRGLFPFSL